MGTDASPGRGRGPGAFEVDPSGVSEGGPVAAGKVLGRGSLSQGGSVGAGVDSRAAAGNVVRSSVWVWVSSLTPSCPGASGGAPPTVVCAVAPADVTGAPPAATGGAVPESQARVPWRKCPKARCRAPATGRSRMLREPALGHKCDTARPVSQSPGKDCTHNGQEPVGPPPSWKQS